MNHLTGAAERALKERRGLLLEGDSASDDENAFPQSYHVAYPIEVSAKLHGVVVLEVEQNPRARGPGHPATSPLGRSVARGPHPANRGCEIPGGE